jgi:ABC-type transport system substrate-binding protein
MKIVPEAATWLAMVQTGESDISFYLKGALQHKARTDPKLKFSPSPSPSVFYLVPHDQWNPKSPWSDLRVRKAVSLAMDRKMMVETTDFGAGIPGGISPNDFLYTLRLEPDPYDPKKAKALMAEAGYPNGFDAGTLSGQSTFPRRWTSSANICRRGPIKIKKWKRLLITRPWSNAN